MTPKEIEQLARVCLKCHITHLKLGDLEIKLDLASQPPPRTRGKKADKATPEAPAPVNEEELLFWSSPNQ